MLRQATKLRPTGYAIISRPEITLVRMIQACPAYRMIRRTVSIVANSMVALHKSLALPVRVSRSSRHPQPVRTPSEQADIKLGHGRYHGETSWMSSTPRAACSAALPLWSAFKC